jgi:hypothetical protein
MMMRMDHVSTKQKMFDFLMGKEFFRAQRCLGDNDYFDRAHPAQYPSVCSNVQNVCVEVL